MLIDLHVHSRFSFDSSEAVENYIEKAMLSGLPVVGFSEHYDYDAVIDNANIVPCNIPAYMEYLSNIKLKDRHGRAPEILRGIELGYRDVAVEKYWQLAAENNFDYIINSVHTLPERGDCFHDRFFAGRTLKENYREYFKAVLESVKAKFDFQIIGHIGYVSRYREGEDSKIFYRDFNEILDEILIEIIARDKCLEINTSTGKSAGLSLPDIDIIMRYLQLGGKKMSFGSDAHKVADYMRKSQELISFLHSQGVYELFYYRQRQPIAYKI